ncbi:Ribosome biogenesis protein tsr1 [Drechslerella dactyloides]|uniref:Ribosome biogenesis protein tsr1 n=1 Tax=Drechslerella dactyloides TaxID=74499 RepID=A0AAD6IZB6_DREDA|nr:Ribosome biogenesis protein tsr1 [Drechslerella dactyloides]
MDQVTCRGILVLEPAGVPNRAEEKMVGQEFHRRRPPVERRDMTLPPTNQQIRASSIVVDAVRSKCRQLELESLLRSANIEFLANGLLRELTLSFQVAGCFLQQQFCRFSLDCPLAVLVLHALHVIAESFLFDALDGHPRAAAVLFDRIVLEGLDGLLFGVVDTGVLLPFLQCSLSGDMSVVPADGDRRRLVVFRVHLRRRRRCGARGDKRKRRPPHNKTQPTNFPHWFFLPASKLCSLTSTSPPAHLDFEPPQTSDSQFLTAASSPTATMVSNSHHHRSGTKSGHKPFKSRHATKGQLAKQNKGKVERTKGVRQSPVQALKSKLDRRNQARQKQLQKAIERAKNDKIFDGRNGAPRIVAVVPLCADTSAEVVLNHLNTALDMETQKYPNGVHTIGVDRFKQKIQYIVPERKLLPVLDACKFADFIFFILSATQEVDDIGDALLRAIEWQGVSTVFSLVQNLNQVEPAKRRPDVKKSLLSYMNHFFAEEDKIYAVDSASEALNAIRSVCTQHPKGILWRDARSYMLGSELAWDSAEEKAYVMGTVRGKGLKADRLVQLQGGGVYQVEKVVSLPNESHKGDAMDTSAVIDAPSQDQDSLDQVSEEVNMEEEAGSLPDTRKGVLLDDHHYFDDDEIDGVVSEPVRKRKLPPGTSESMGRWIVDSDTDDSDLEDDEEVEELMETEMEPEVTMDVEEEMDDATTTFGTSKSEMFLDLSPEEEVKAIAEFRQRKKEAEEDLEFPDEFELRPDEKARERLHRYRGLKDFRTSPWETSEDVPFQPKKWDALTHIDNYKATKLKAQREALVGGAAAGSKVKVYLRDVPKEFAIGPVDEYNSRITGLFSLLRHEHKKAVVNYSITLSGDYEAPPIKSKDTLILQCGSRRWKVQPLFSQGGATKNNVHKYEQFLQPGRTCVATVVGEISFGNVPVLWWKQHPNGIPHPPYTILYTNTNHQTGNLELVGTGSFLNTDHDRVIAKRRIITGHPYKIHKKLVTVRYMFFNAEDVNWFKALPLHTKRGRSGFIKESLGTHGYFKATFDGKLNPQDTVCVYLYKRCFPSEAEEWHGR